MLFFDFRDLLILLFNFWDTHLPQEKNEDYGSIYAVYVS